MDYKVLMIDDEKELADSTAEYFNMLDLKTCCAYSVSDALEFFKENSAQLILLDINLGDGSGFNLCKTIRQTMNVPILFISARSSDDDMVVALNIGGDDYITKPYSLNVLYAKVRAVLKRYEGSGNPTGETFVFGDVEVDLGAGVVRRGGVDADLTAIEFKLLSYLVTNRNKVVEKQDIFDNVWEESFVSDGTLNVHIRHLREKLEKDPNEPEYIRTARGRGYIFKAESR